jgi:hypothetical protein
MQRSFLPLDHAFQGDGSDYHAFLWKNAVRVMHKKEAQIDPARNMSDVRQSLGSAYYIVVALRKRHGLCNHRD